MLQQRDLEYGPLWCDGGVYCKANELQLLNPEMFSNIFLRLGGFHMEKTVIACCGTYLASTGIENVLVEHDIYGPGVVKSLMNGSNYIRGKRSMVLLAETLQSLQLDAFTSLSHDALKDVKVKENMIALKICVTTITLTSVIAGSSIKSQWKSFYKHSMTLSRMVV